MVTVKVLKRKDGAALVVGVVVGLIINELVFRIVQPLSAQLSGQGSQGMGSWQANYAQPLITAVLEFIALELLIWLYASVTSATKKS